MESFICSKCQYDLTGLPAQGACPECGQEYDTRERRGISDYANRAERAQFVFARMRTIWCAVMAALALGVGTLLTIAGKPGSVWIGLLFAVVFVLATLVSYTSERPER